MTLVHDSHNALCPTLEVNVHHQLIIHLNTLGLAVFFCKCLFPFGIMVSGATLLTVFSFAKAHQTVRLKIKCITLGWHGHGQSLVGTTRISRGPFGMVLDEQKKSAGGALMLMQFLVFCVSCHIFECHKTM